MSNVMEYKDIMAFHPGYYVSEIIEDMGISQCEFAQRLGTTPKTVSLLVNGECDLSDELCKKMSIMTGTSLGLWLGLQKTFDEKKAEIEKKEFLDRQAKIAKSIDYGYFIKYAGFPKTSNVREKVINFCGFFKISDLNILLEPDFLVNYRTGIADINEKNIINARAWLQTAINFASEKNTAPFEAEKLKGYLPEIRSMTVMAPEVFLKRLNDIFSECGVAFVLLPHLKNSGINGAVKWLSNNKVMLAVNDRRHYADTFWFSLFHEIKHILQQKHKTLFISGAEELDIINKKLEKEADEFAGNYLIPQKDYVRIICKTYISDADICAFAEQIGIHPGIVAGRLQHDKIIAQNRCTKLKTKYKIV